MTKITMSEARSQIESIIAEFPNGHKGQNPGQPFCVYFIFDDWALVPSCIIGQWLHRHGLLRLASSSGDDDGIVSGWICQFDSSFWERFEGVGFHVSLNARAFLREVQDTQDNLISWDDINLDEAEKVARFRTGHSEELFWDE